MIIRTSLQAEFGFLAMLLASQWVIITTDEQG
jgi:hypothetical protein